MKILKLISILFLLLSIIACEENSTESDLNVNENNTELTFNELDSKIGEMVNINLISIYAQMPNNFPIDLNLFGGLGKSNYSKLTKINSDSLLFNLLSKLDSLYGTHEFNGTEWIKTSGSTSEMNFIFTINNSTNQQQSTVLIKIHSLAIGLNEVSMSIDLYLDDQKILWTNYTIEGNNLIIPNIGKIVKVTVSIGFIDVAGLDENIIISIENSEVSIELLMADGDKVQIIAYGNDLLNSGIIDNNFERAEIIYKELKIEITDFTDTDGDKGDVYLAGNKVGDLILENDFYYVVFESGKKVSMAELMKNVNSYIVLFSIL